MVAGQAQSRGQFVPGRGNRYPEQTPTSGIRGVPTPGGGRQARDAGNRQSCLERTVGLGRGLAWLLSGLLLIGCAARREAPRPAPLPPDALVRFERALDLLANDQIGPNLVAARAELEGAIAAAPDWVAPQRQLDDLDRLLLLGQDAYRRRLAAKAQQPFSGAAEYLLARLEVGHSRDRFAEAAERDPRLAWAWHGQSIEAQYSGNEAEAWVLAQAAALRARGDYELAFFGRRAAQLAPTEELAREELEQVLTWAELPWGPQMAGLLADLAVVEMRQGGAGSIDPVERERGLQRALRLLRELRLEPDELRRLVLSAASATSGRSPAGVRFELRQALLAGPNLRPEGSGPSAPADPAALAVDWGEFVDLERFLANAQPRIGLPIQSEPDPPSVTAEGLANGTPELAPLAPEWRADILTELVQGQAPATLERWLASLPSAIKSADGLPRWSALAQLVDRLRIWGQAPPTQPEQWDQLAPWLIRALLDMGWSREALSVLAHWREHSPRARFPGNVECAQLEACALAQEAFLGELETIVTGLHRKQRSFSLEPLGPREVQLEPRGPATNEPTQSAPAQEAEGRGLTAVLVAAGRLADRYGPSLGWPADAGAKIAATPRIEYGGLAQVTIPSPSYCARDEALGHGPAGEPVPGLPQLLATIGRAGLFGKHLAGTTDGTVLRLVGVEERSGTHLGVPFNGLVLYCDGADADGARSQSGGRVAGAALHEGYWIDLEVERQRLSVWHDLARRWFAPDAAEARRAALAAGGLSLSEHAGSHDLLRLLRRSGKAPLGESRRVALALLAERQAANPSGFPWLDLDELLTLVQTHEEGHLCDRTRFLPLSEHRLEALTFALVSGFDPRRVEQRLEYRAQLTALAAAPEPRFALVEILDALETHPAQRSVHGRAYANLAQDLLDAFDRHVEQTPDRFPGIEPNCTLVHQFHRLPAESVRFLAMDLARREGLMKP
jgi:hypothetical protein